jgi:hypothetical protein
MVSNMFCLRDRLKGIVNFNRLSPRIKNFASMDINERWDELNWKYYDF